MKQKNRPITKHLWPTVLGLHSPLKKVDLYPHYTTLSMLGAFILLCSELILIIIKTVFPCSTPLHGDVNFVLIDLLICHFLVLTQ